MEGTNCLDLTESGSSNAENDLVYDDCVPQESVASQRGAQFWVFGADDLSSPVSVKGRLRNNVKFWRDVLHAPPSVLQVIGHGYSYVYCRLCQSPPSLGEKVRCQP